MTVDVRGANVRMAVPADIAPPQVIGKDEDYVWFVDIFCYILREAISRYKEIGRYGHKERQAFYS